MEDAITIIKHKIAVRQQEIAQLEQEILLKKAAIGVLTETLQDIQGSEGKWTTGTDPIISIANSIASRIIDKGRALRQGSLNDTARSVLKESREFLSGNDLFEKVREKQPDAKQASLLSGIYGLARKSRIFVLENNKIGLLEWGETGIGG
jgi:hypothetical protein